MKRISYLIVVVGLIAGAYALVNTTTEAATSLDYGIRLASGELTVSPASNAEFIQELRSSRFAERGVLLQFYNTPTEAERRLLGASGIRLFNYIPNSTFLASVPSSLSGADLTSAGVRWIGALRAEDKIAQSLALMGTPPWSRDSSGVSQFTIKVFGHVALDDAAAWLENEYGAIVDGTSSLINGIDVRLPADNWYDIASDERVQWIEPFLPRRELNNSNRVNTAAETVQSTPYSLDGSNVMVAEWDGGHADVSHPDLAGRVFIGEGGTGGAGSHPTHVAGTVMGDGTQSGGTYRGMAPNAELATFTWFSTISNMQDEYQLGFDNFDMDISTNSWGIGAPPSSIEVCESFLGNYFAVCEALDNVIRGDLGKTVAVSWAAGNERSGGADYCGSLGMTFGTIIPYGTAKNTITVGAINSNNSSMTSFSSWGPVDDGRIKPELVAPGCEQGNDWGVTSTRVGGGYSVKCGTSMATPTTAGCFALWMQRYKELYPGQVPLSSTVRAVFCETADDIGDPGPEFDFGFGRLNVQNAVDVLNAGAFTEAEITDGDTLTWTFAMSPAIDSFSFTLAWDDPGAVENAIPTLINDLELRVQTAVAFGATYRPWQLDPGSPAAHAIVGEDHTNNIEKVEREITIPATGTWRVLVIGHNVPMGPQKFSLAHSPMLTLTQGEADYAADLISGPNVLETPGSVNIEFLLFNTGRQPDTYDLSLTSARGWAISPNPTSVAMPARGDSTEVFTVMVPPGTAVGTKDTIECTLVSQADPAVTDTDLLEIEVTAGYGSEISALTDTAGVQGRTFDIDVVISNTGTQPDVFDWTIADNAGWSISPSSGVESLPLAGNVTVPVTIAISPSTPAGTTNPVVITSVSQTDPVEVSTHTIDVDVIAFPPLPVLSSPINGVSSTETSPELTWGHDPYTPFPPGFDVFEYALEVADDTNHTVGVTRFEGLTATTFSFGVPLGDGVYYWRVITYNAAGDSSGYSPSARFEVDTQAPDAPTLVYPDLFGVNRTPTFQWAQVTSRVMSASTVAPMTYHFELAEDTAMSLLIDSTTTEALSYLLPVSHLLPRCSSVVYWRVTATDAAGNTSQPADPRRYQVYIVGDLNVDCLLDSRDLNALIGQIFFNVQPPDPAIRGELNCILGIDALDLNHMISYLFFNGPAPCVP